MKTDAVAFALALMIAIAAPCRAHPGCGIVVDSSGQVLFVDGVRNRIMKIDAAGTLTLFVSGEAGGKLSNPHHLSLDAEGHLYSVGDRDGVVWRISLDGKTARLYPPELWYGLTFVGIGGNPFTVDRSGTVYCLNSRQFRHAQILKIGPDGRVSVLAGGDWGHADGQEREARFGDLHGARFVLAPDGSLFLTDGGTSVRRITPDGTVTTLAGAAEPGFADGDRRMARFRSATGLALDRDGNVIVADYGNGRIRKVHQDGKVTTLPGAFQNPSGVAVAGDGSIYVLEWIRDDPRVRKLAADGKITLAAKVR